MRVVRLAVVVCALAAVTGLSPLGPAIGNVVAPQGELPVSVAPTLTAADRAVVTRVLQADARLRALAPGGPAVVDMQPWVRTRDSSTIGALVRLRLPHPFTGDVHWPGVHYDDATDSYRTTTAALRVRGVRTVTAMVDVGRSAVVAIEALPPAHVRAVGPQLRYPPSGD